MSANCRDATIWAVPFSFEHLQASVRDVSKIFQKNEVQYSGGTGRLIVALVLQQNTLLDHKK